MRLHWPKSLPDYQWPPFYTSAAMMPVRLLLASLFHLCFAVGSLVSLLPWRREKVLVIRTDGLGDALLFEPALETLSRAVSPRLVEIWAPKLSCEILANAPGVATMRTIPRGFKAGNLLFFRSIFWRAKIGFMLGATKFETVIYPAESPEPLGNWLIKSSRTKDRWANFGDTINQFDWQQAAAHESAKRVFENRPGNAHELVRNAYLAEQWSGEKSLRAPRLHLAESKLENAAAQIERWRSAARKFGGAELLGIVPAGSISINHYPAAQWAEALAKIWDEHRGVGVLLGAASDRNIVEQLAAALTLRKVPHLRLGEYMPLQDMAALIGKLDAILSVDTGLAHLAVAQSVPSVVLVGGGNPGRFFPWPEKSNHVALNVAMECSHCNNRCTQPEARCITHIEPEEIARGYAHVTGRRVPLEVFIVRPAAKLQATA